MKNFVKYALLLAAAVFCIGLILKPVKAYAAPEESAITEEAEGKLRTTMMLGLVFVETVVIYALIVAILIVFVL